MDYLKEIKGHIDNRFKERKYSGYDSIFDYDCSPLKLYVKWIVDGKSAPSNNITIFFSRIDIRNIETQNTGDVAEDAFKDVLNDLDSKLKTIHKNTTREEYTIDFGSKITGQLEKKHGYDFSK